jgi:2-keto-3-deoxy-L-rhamnonate aldolase RhmA
MPPSLKDRLTAGETLFGTLLSLASLETAEILAVAGFDWLFVDLEHSPLGPREVQAVLQAIAGRVDCLLRVPLADEIWLKKALDSGAAGVIVPQVNTAEQARQVVRWCKYPPQGTRSVGLGRAQGYGADLQPYLERANRETLVVAQIEHAQAVENIDAILEVDGLDALFVGPYDLSASLGPHTVGQVDHPEVQAAIARVNRACRACGMPLGIFTAGAQRARAYAAEGFRLIATGADTLLLAQAARKLLDDLHG